MKKNRIIVFSIILLSILCIGWRGSWDSIKHTASTIHSVQAVFVQKKIMKILARPLVSRGKFYYQDPDSLRWEYVSPLQSILLMERGKLSRYIKVGGSFEKDSTVNMQAMQVVVQEIAQWLKGEFTTNKDFNASLKRGGRIILTPKEKAFAKIIKRIELKLSRHPGIIDWVKIVESKDSYTLLQFRNVVLNKKIDQAVFRKL